MGNGACGSVYKCKYNDTICIGKCFYYRDYENKTGLINDVYSELSIYSLISRLDTNRDQNTFLAGTSKISGFE